MRLLLPLLALLLVSPAALAHVRIGHGGAACGGPAPSVTACSTGDHLNTWSNDVTLDFADTAANYTGTVEHTLTQGRHAYAYRCDITSGVVGACAASGTFPVPGVVYAHECRSYDQGTTTPGGAGAWRCRIYHTSV